jgi:CTP synthase
MLPNELRMKISRFCDVPVQNVIAAPDVDNIYSLPLVFFDQGLDQRILDFLSIWTGVAHLERWRTAIERSAAAKKEVRIAIVGKYVHLTDTYKSLNEALKHGGIPNDTKVQLHFVDSEEITDEQSCTAFLDGVDGILIPGGFGERGVEGKILAIHHARINKIPFFGICLGMQLAVVEFSRFVLGLKDANSREFHPEAKDILIDLMNEQHEVTQKGGTMRLGSYSCHLLPESKVSKIYGAEIISERHRHRYEVNPEYFERLEVGGLKISGRSPDGKLAEVVELKSHPYFVACQFHPEFQSKLLEPHPLFVHFIAASQSHREKSKS